jgi:hypothetical protein
MMLACAPLFVPMFVLAGLAYLTPALSRPPNAPIPPPDATLMTFGLLAVLPGAVLVGTAGLLLRYALYQRATGGSVRASYAACDLEAALPGTSAADHPGPRAELARS